MQKELLERVLPAHDERPVGHARAEAEVDTAHGARPAPTAPVGDGNAFELDQRRSGGTAHGPAPTCRTRLSPSASKLTPITSSEIASAGKVSVQGVR